MIIIGKNRLSRVEISIIKKIIGKLLTLVKDTQTIPYVEQNPVADRETIVETDYKIKRQVLSLVSKYRKDINEDDLPKIQSELTAFFDSQSCQPYHLVMDRRFETQDKRFVIIGDTHCDYKSLAGIFEKLSLSSYDYFNNATFVFLGDYLDRGQYFFEYLMLLVGFKKLLGNRCILLKGNHELITYNSKIGKLESKVYPAETCPTLNYYCGANKSFLSKFAGYFSKLPYYLILKTPKGTDLLVHGGIPRDSAIEKCKVSLDTGEMHFKGDAKILDSALDNMIWADPRKEPFKRQGGSSRFEFGSKQFKKFVDSNKINRIFRSHEPVQNGVESFYDDRLYTVFSNGGANNTLSGYPEVDNPVFAIIGADGEVRFESIFFKKVTIRKGYTSINTILYMGEDANADFSIKQEDLHLNSEFFVINQ